MECFYQDETMLYIDPEECICCAACVPECPVEAIFDESNVPARWTQFIQLNCERVSALKESGHITERQEPKEGGRLRRSAAGLNWVRRCFSGNACVPGEAKAPLQDHLDADGVLPKHRRRVSFVSRSPKPELTGKDAPAMFHGGLLRFGPGTCGSSWAEWPFFTRRLQRLFRRLIEAPDEFRRTTFALGQVIPFRGIKMSIADDTQVDQTGTGR